MVALRGSCSLLGFGCVCGVAVGDAVDSVAGEADFAVGAAGKGVATPANWNVGDDVVIPVAVSNEDAKAKFGEFNTVLPYLRMTKL